MRRHPLMPRLPRSARRAARIVATLGIVLSALGPMSAPVAAVDPPTMEARVLLGGHARIGSWIAISVHLKNDGPAVTGELRLAGGTQGQTRFGSPVDLPPLSDKTYVLYAQPPAFGSQLKVQLIDGDTTIVAAEAKYTVHDANQLVVAVVAERPEGIVGSLDLLPNANQVAPLIVNLTPEDLPERVEAWGTIDRLVWQDVDSERLSREQRDAMRSWVAGGGRLVIVGGTAGPKALSALPDVLLPYRPLITTEVPAASLSGILGELPPTATSLSALSGTVAEGRVLASVGDAIVAAERSYGAGTVTLLGFDPSVDWIARTDTSKDLWRRLLPTRASGGLTFADDSALVNAVSQLPSLALPPIGGLIALLGAYILLIGPINYFVLRRLDRREWAWFTMPLLIVVFAVGAYGIGAALRGSDLIVNQVAIVRGAPGATDGTAQIYLGIFSPTRGTYQLRIPGGALLSAPINADFLGGNSPANRLDVLQGDPARVRDLAVGFGLLRTIRAESPVVVPLVETDLRLADGRLKGTVKNASSVRLERPAVVLGSTVAPLDDLAPGAVATIDVLVQSDQSGRSLSEKIVGQVFFGEGIGTADTSRLYARQAIVNQLTNDPNSGSSNRLSAEGPVVLAWGSASLLPVEIENQEPRHLANVLYYLPARMSVSGLTTFRSDVIRSTIVKADAGFFSQEPNFINFGRGSATIAYRPAGMVGSIAATEIAIALNFGDVGLSIEPTVIEPLASIPAACPNPPTPDCDTLLVDDLPEVELFDIEAQEWKRLPHLSHGIRYAVADPGRYLDPTSGTVLVRYVNDVSEKVGFSVDLSISGVVR